MGGLKNPMHAPSKEDAGLNGPIDPKHWKGGTYLGGPQIPTHPPGKETKGSVTPQSHVWGVYVWTCPRAQHTPSGKRMQGSVTPQTPIMGGEHMYGVTQNLNTYTKGRGCRAQ